MDSAKSKASEELNQCVCVCGWVVCERCVGVCTNVRLHLYSVSKLNHVEYFLFGVACVCDIHATISHHLSFPFTTVSGLCRHSWADPHSVINAVHWLPMVLVVVGDKRSRRGHNDGCGRVPLYAQ